MTPPPPPPANSPPPGWSPPPPRRQRPPRRGGALPALLSILAGIVVLALFAAVVVALHGGADADRPERGSERLLQLTPGNPAVHYGTPAAFDDGDTCRTDLNGDSQPEFRTGKATVTLHTTHEPPRLLEPAARQSIRNLA